MNILTKIINGNCDEKSNETVMRIIMKLLMKIVITLLMKI